MFERVDDVEVVHSAFPGRAVNLHSQYRITLLVYLQGRSRSNADIEMSHPFRLHCGDASNQPIYGISVHMFFKDHAAPHFHAIYGEHEALVQIDDGQLIAGVLPNRAKHLVSEWLWLHREELQENWAPVPGARITGASSPASLGFGL